jgi:DNA-directed RNA polymerase specialized sigma24 family protein
VPALSPSPEGLAERLAALVAARFGSLVGTARRAGAGADAEDVVQEVVTRFLEQGRDVPEQADALAAYLRRSVARDSGRGTARRFEELPEELPENGTELADAMEDRRRVGAYARALERLPQDVQPVLLLDVAGLDGATIAARTGRSERSVKRVLAEHAGAVLSTVVAEVDGTACVRLSATLEAVAATGWRLRRDGETTRHLEVCDACRLSYLEARRTRVAVGSVLLLPAGLARKVASTIAVRTLRRVVHLRRAAFLPLAASVSAVVPVVVFPQADLLPRHVPRVALVAPVAASAEPAIHRAPVRAVPVRAVAAPTVPTAHPTHRRVSHRKVAVPRPPTTPTPTPTPKATPPPTAPAPTAACAFGSATIGC